MTTVPELSNLPGVQLMRTGQWETSTGRFTFTPDDLAEAVAAQACPAIRKPVLKLGHTDPRFDGEPAVGWVESLAVSDDGHSLDGDYVGMPGWLGPVLASAYPDRSIEGEYRYKCALGHTHPFVVTAVALLGVTEPAIGTLESLQDVAKLYGVAAASPATGEPVRINVKGKGMPERGNAVAAGLSVEDVRRAYYEAAPFNIWIEEFSLDPLQLIVVDDDGDDRYRIPIEIGPDGATFGTPVPVVVVYEDAQSEDKPPLVTASAPIRYASRTDSRPGGKPAASTTSPAEVAGVPTEKEDKLSEFHDIIRAALGVTDEVSEDDLVAKLNDALKERDEALEAATAPVDGTVVVDAAMFEDLKVAAALGRTAHERLEEDDRRKTVDAAVRAGKIPPARRGHWETLLKADPGSATVLASMASGVIPVGNEVGYAADAPVSAADDSDVYNQLFGKDAR